jgi:hypothetical protein
MSKPDAHPFDPYEWAAVCECGWAASSEGANAGRHRIEQLGINHDRQCDDVVMLERRGGETTEIKQLAARWNDDSNDQV